MAVLLEPPSPLGFPPSAALAPSAVTVIPAVGVLVYRPLFASGALTRRTALAATVAGVVVFVPLFAGLVAIARRVERVLS